MNSSALMDNLRQLFAECDTDNNGSLGREEFSELCAKIGLNRDAADETFARLDIDKNNRITFDEFAAGFNQYANKQQVQSSPQSRSPAPNAGAADSTPRTMTGAPRSVAARSPVAARRQRLGTPASPCGSPVSGRVAGRKSASPLGLVSLGSAGSSGANLTSISRSGSAGGFGGNGATGHDASGELFSSSTNNSDSYFQLGDEKPAAGQQNPVVVYSSDLIADYDQASGSGQFGSLLSSSGSFSGARNMQDLLECVQKLQSENQILSQIFFKDKREREEYISQLGEEFDQQVREVEERANKRARDELESEKRRLREMMQAERETLQHHYQTIERMSKLIKSPNSKLDEDSIESIDKVRSKLEDTYLENRKLKRSLLDTKTDVAMIWKEMEKLKQQYESKLSNAYERNNETKNECDHIKQQLNLMKDSNKKLQDASDVITTYITDKVEPVIKVATINEDDPNFLGAGGLSSTGANSLGGSFRLGNASQAASRRGSILSEYLNGADQGDDSLELDQTVGSTTSADVESLGSSVGRSSRSRTDHQRAGAEDRLSPTSGDSPATNLKVPSSRSKSPSRSRDRSPIRKGFAEPNGSDIRQSASKSSACDDVSSSDHQSISANKTKPPDHIKGNISAKTEAKSNGKSGFRNIGRHFFIGTRTQSDSHLAAEDDNKQPDNKQLSGANISTSVDNCPDEPVVGPADGPSEATFNIILVGDSFVGKSSFAARFMEGSFVQGLISNCSIDFKTKAYKVDGTNYTVNLWDTAGQERFRSITASYFRKADGIILMYDVTDKRSYLNVRNWMSTISDTAAENVAVLLIGNKIDLRNKSNEEKCVPTNEGSRLAKEYNIVFLETSVKTGTNLVPSMGRLIR